ncbi:hypothetical protein RJ640_002901 [Escallonia rubra]|uniref:DUF4283 domain-containing protein n=1 Tax=Escallonia rubra TaxID=112253 RepID=A0AA88QAG8_9ASTE|nr:hypothetical protein RJ640_002901 [Escallonia rubra]
MEDDLVNKWKKFSLTAEESEGVMIPARKNEGIREKGSLCLVGRLLSKRPYNFEAFRNTMIGAWRLTKKLDIKKAGEQLIMVQFFHRLDKQRVMDGSPWSFDKQLLILKEYDGDIQPSEIDLTWSPFWIQIHNLPFNQREKGTGEAISKKCGQVLDIDVNADGIGWGRCLRVRVLVDVMSTSFSKKCFYPSLLKRIKTQIKNADPNHRKINHNILIVMAGQTDTVTKPSRSDAVLDPDHQLQMASLVRAHSIPWHLSAPSSSTVATTPITISPSEFGLELATELDPTIGWVCGFFLKLISRNNSLNRQVLPDASVVVLLPEFLSLQSQSQAIILGANDAVEQDESKNASIRKGHHERAYAVVEEIPVQVETYHLFDRLVIRIPRAIIELCIQAGVDLPELALPKVNLLMQRKVNYKTGSSGTAMLMRMLFYLRAFSLNPDNSKIKGLELSRLSYTYQKKENH